jgi:hypothetical protein
VRIASLAALLLALLAAAAGAAAQDVGAAAAPRAAPDPTARVVLDKVLEVVHRPEFEGSEEEEEGLLLILANLLSDFVDSVREMKRTNPIAYGAIWAWLLLTVTAITGHIAWTVWKGGAGGASRRGGASVLDPALATRAGRDPERMLARAEEARARDGLEAAVPWLYLALLFRLERAGLVEFDPSRTGLEYADALARHAAARETWTSFLRRHDPVVFGERRCGEADFAAMEAAARGPVPAPGAA